MTDPVEPSYKGGEDFDPHVPGVQTLQSRAANDRVGSLLTLLDAYGYPYTLEPGWTTRNPGYNWYSTSAEGDGPYGIMVHHTGTAEYAPRRSYPAPQGTRTDGKTICNILLQPDGVLNFVSTDPSNYSAGLNQKALLTDYVLKSRRFNGPQSGSMGPEWYGNRAWIAIEVVNLGNGAPMPDVQEEALVAVCAMMCAIMSWDATQVISHSDGRGTKQDPRWDGPYGKPPYSIAGIQDAITNVLNSGEVPEPPDPIDPPIDPPVEPPTGDGYMFPTIRKGDGYISGPHPEWRGAVVAMQAQLAYHEYADEETAGGVCAFDGAFGDGSEESLKDFQKDHSLTADGICGAKSWAKLIDRK